MCNGRNDPNGPTTTWTCLEQRETGEEGHMIGCDEINHSIITVTAADAAAAVQRVMPS